MELNIAHINPYPNTCAYNDKRFTVVVETIDRDTLMDYLDTQFEERIEPLVLKAGDAKCHPNDNYNRKSGVAIATNCIENAQFDYLGTQRIESRHHHMFLTYVYFMNVKYRLYITLSTVPHSDNVKLERAYICDDANAEY